MQDGATTRDKNFSDEDLLTKIIVTIVCVLAVVLMLVLMIVVLPIQIIRAALGRTSWRDVLRTPGFVLFRSSGFRV